VVHCSTTVLGVDCRFLDGHLYEVKEINHGLLRGFGREWVLNFVRFLSV
jgi:hypothetical protein